MDGWNLSASLGAVARNIFSEFVCMQREGTPTTTDMSENEGVEYVCLEGSRVEYVDPFAIWSTACRAAECAYARKRIGSWMSTAVYGGRAQELGLADVWQALDGVPWHSSGGPLVIDHAAAEFSGIAGAQCLCKCSCVNAACALELAMAEIARARYVDDVVCSNGHPQVLAIGAGTCSRTHRLAPPPHGARWFVVDRSDALHVRAATLARIYGRFGGMPTVAVAWTGDDACALVADLRSSGFDVEAPTTVIFEGFVNYMRSSVRTAIFRDKLSLLLAPGSVVVGAAMSVGMLRTGIIRNIVAALAATSPTQGPRLCPIVDTQQLCSTIGAASSVRVQSLGITDVGGACDLSTLAGFARLGNGLDIFTVDIGGGCTIGAVCTVDSMHSAPMARH